MNINTLSFLSLIVVVAGITIMTAVGIIYDDKAKDVCYAAVYVDASEDSQCIIRSDDTGYVYEDKKSAQEALKHAVEETRLISNPGQQVIPIGIVECLCDPKTIRYHEEEK